MHISDGVLSGTVCIVSGCAAGLITAYSLKKINQDNIPKISLMTAAFFVVSLIYIKIGPSSTHLILNGLVGIILGIYSFPAILVALLFQSIMFQHGGITALGANSIIMGLPALLSYLIYKTGTGKSENKIIQSAAAFSAGTVSVLLSAFFTSLFLIFTEKEFFETSKIIIAVYIPISIFEGFITLFIVSFLMKVKPEIIAYTAVKN